MNMPSYHDIGNIMVEITCSYDHLISTMASPIPVKCHLHMILINYANMLNCFKDYSRCIHISCHVSDFVQPKKTKFTMDQPYMLLNYPILTIPCLLMLWRLYEPGHHQAWYWPQSRNIPSPASEEYTSLTDMGAHRRLFANQREVMTRLLELLYVLNIKRNIF